MFHLRDILWLQPRVRVLLLLQEPKYLVYLTFAHGIATKRHSCVLLPVIQKNMQRKECYNDTEKHQEKRVTKWVTPGPDGAVDLRSHGYFNGACGQRLYQKENACSIFGTYKNMKPEFHF